MKLLHSERLQLVQKGPNSLQSFFKLKFQPPQVTKKRLSNKFKDQLHLQVRFKANFGEHQIFFRSVP